MGKVLVVRFNSKRGRKMLTGHGVRARTAVHPLIEQAVAGCSISAKAAGALDWYSANRLLTKEMRCPETACGKWPEIVPSI
jgi:hypothetical protein